MTDGIRQEEVARRCSVAFQPCPRMCCDGDFAELGCVRASHGRPGIPERSHGKPFGFPFLVLSPLAHRFTRRQLSKVRAGIVFRFSAQLNFIDTVVRRDPGKTGWNGTRHQVSHQNSPFSHPVSCSFLEGEGHWVSSRNPGTKSLQE